MGKGGKNGIGGIFKMSSKYDKIIEPEVGLEYGVLRGFNYIDDAVFIKLPKNADIYGYRAKFFAFANAIALRKGCLVICSEHHSDEISAKHDMEILQKYPNKRWTFVGIDEGATYGLSQLRHKQKFEKMVLINMPMTHELGKTIELLNGIDRNNIKFVYGERDESYKYTPLLKRLYIDVFTVKGADHTFSDMMYSFVMLQRFV